MGTDSPRSFQDVSEKERSGQHERGFRRGNADAPESFIRKLADGIRKLDADAGALILFAFNQNLRFIRIQQPQPGGNVAQADAVFTFSVIFQELAPERLQLVRRDAGAVVLDKYDITVDKAELFALRVDRGIERIIVRSEPFVLPFQCRDLFLQRRVLVRGLLQLLLLLREVVLRLVGRAFCAVDRREQRFDLARLRGGLLLFGGELRRQVVDLCFQRGQALFPLGEVILAQADGPALPRKAGKLPDRKTEADRGDDARADRRASSRRR